MMNVNYSYFTSITETPGELMTQDQIDMIKLRYFFSSRLVDWSRGVDVLEIACGAALGFQYLCDLGAKSITGIDINHENIERASLIYKGNENIKFLQGNALDIPLNEKFDLILCFEAVFYFSDVEKYLQECVRLLKPDGKVVICLPNKEIKGFIPSPHSTQYFNNVEMVKKLELFFSKVDYYGAYEIKSNALKNARFLRIKFAQLMNVMPYSREIKYFLKKVLLKKNQTLSDKLEIKHGFVANINRKNEREIDDNSKILYFIAESPVKHRAISSEA